MIWDTNKIINNKAGCRVNRDMVLDGCPDFSQLVRLWRGTWFPFRVYVSTFFGSGPSADPNYVISLFSGLLVSMDPFRLGILNFGSFQKMAFFPILLLWLLSFLKFNTPERGMGVGPAIKIIEVCFHLLVMFPGQDWDWDFHQPHFEYSGLLLVPGKSNC